MNITIIESLLFDLINPKKAWVFHKKNLEFYKDLQLKKV